MSVAHFEILPEILERTPEGALRFRGHRVYLIDVLEHLFAESPELSLTDRFPTIAPEKLRAVAEYCVRHSEFARELLAEGTAALRSRGDVNPPNGPSPADLEKRLQEKTPRKSEWRS